jgi:GINS complex subunit 4
MSSLLLLGDSEDLLASANDDATTNGVNVEEEEEEEELTPAEVVQRMKTAWTNEKFSPRLLPAQTELLSCLLEQLSQMEANLAQVGKADFRIPLHKMEVARIRFLMTSYLRLRLAKIQSQIWTLDADLLSREEVAFSKSHRASLEAHVKTLASRHMPGDFGQMPKSTPDAPLPEGNVDCAVFVRAEQEVRAVLIEDPTLQGRDQEVDMDAGSQHILKYAAVEELVKEGAVRLI